MFAFSTTPAPDFETIIFNNYLNQERLADVNVRKKIQIFTNFFRGLKIMVETWFLYWIVQKILHFFLQKTELIYLENCQVHSDLLLELFKTANFSKILT